MLKRLLAVYLVLAVLVGLLIPSCTPTEKGTINVRATLCGEPWQGVVNYTLSLA